MRRQKPMVRLDAGQRGVVVRVDVVIYILIGVIAILAITSAVFPERVELAIISALATLVAGILGGWLTYMRLTQGRGEDNDLDAESPTRRKGSS
jgi:uncharacterized membrane protein